MKIRTDFVTNSSSSNHAEIMIDNPVLLEILQKYRDMGLSPKDDLGFSIGTYASKYSDFRASLDDRYTKTPAFFLYEHCGGEGLSMVLKWPRSLDEVLTCILDIMDKDSGEASNHFDQDRYDPDLYRQLKEELRLREKEIKTGYTKVKWSGEDSEWGMDHKFSYDALVGEKYEEHTDSDLQIVIENPVLLEILQKYKDKGVFANADWRFSIGCYASEDENFQELVDECGIKVPAFFLFGSARALPCPQSLDEVMTNVIDIIDQDVQNNDLYHQLKEELELKKEKIKTGYSKVIWRQAYVEGGGENEEFSYGPEIGEKYEDNSYRGPDENEEPNNEG